MAKYTCGHQKDKSVHFLDWNNLPFLLCCILFYFPFEKVLEKTDQELKVKINILIFKKNGA